MMLKTSELKKSASSEMLETAAQIKEVDSDVRYFQYRAGGYVINVESSASNIMDELTRFPVNFQAELFAGIVAKLPNEGDSELIVDDSETDEKKNRSRRGRVTRLRSDQSNVINLLLTR